MRYIGIFVTQSTFREGDFRQPVPAQALARGKVTMQAYYSAFATASRLSRASPNSMRVFSLTNSGLSTPA